MIIKSTRQGYNINFKEPLSDILVEEFFDGEENGTIWTLGPKKSDDDEVDEVDDEDDGDDDEEIDVMEDVEKVEKDFEEDFEKEDDKDFYEETEFEDDFDTFDDDEEDDDEEEEDGVALYQGLAL